MQCKVDKLTPDRDSIQQKYDRIKSRYHKLLQSSTVVKNSGIKMYHTSKTSQKEWNKCTEIINNCIKKNNNLLKLKQLNTTLSKHLNARQSGCFQNVTQWKNGKTESTVERHSNEIKTVLQNKNVMENVKK